MELLLLKVFALQVENSMIFTIPEALTIFEMDCFQANSEYPNTKSGTKTTLLNCGESQPDINYCDQLINFRLNFNTENRNQIATETFQLFSLNYNENQLMLH